MIQVFSKQSKSFKTKNSPFPTNSLTLSIETLEIRHKILANSPPRVLNPWRTWINKKMKELDKTYNPATVEDKWYSYWLENKLFASKPNPDKEPYTIVIPPPNVTGILHMGHMLNNTIQDVLIRRARMQGKEACWVPGTDHASIATEAKVVNMLKEQGIDKEEIGREKFLEHAWEWKEKYGGIILEQLKKFGASCDWDRTRFTMEEEMNKAVNKIFVDLYDKGYIYRDYRMGNWDPEGKTALADDEVIHKEGTAHLYYVKYAD